MGDNAVIIKLIGLIEGFLYNGGLEGFIVLQKNQPEIQGAPAGKAVYIEPLFDKRYGWPGSEQTFDETLQVFKDVEPQAMEKTFQITCLIRQTFDHTEDTARDVVNYLARALNSRYTVDELMTNNVNVLRVSDVRMMPWSDDMERYEYHPSFDLVVTLVDKFTIEVPRIEEVITTVRRVD